MTRARHTPRPPRLCLFCDRNANSPEHIWSDWMAKHFERGAHDSAFQSTHRLHPDPQPVPVVKKIHGHVVTRKHRVVCTSCNMGWMSGLETPAKTLLEPMLLGQHVEICAESRSHLLNWILLKLMVLERDEGVKPVFNRDEALLFAFNRSIPENISVDLFHTQDDRLRSFLHRESAAIPPDVDPSPGTVVTNLQAVTFGIGRLVIYARHSQLSTLGFKKLSLNISSRLWPDPAERVEWPPPESLSFEDVEFLNGAMGRYLAPMTPI